MSLTPAQVQELRNQLLSQVDKFPQNQRTKAIETINAMSAEEIELMLQQQQSSTANQGNQKGILRRIVDKEIPSNLIEETKEGIAVLDIHPISKGHIIIIPLVAKGDIKSLPQKLFTLAKKIGKRTVVKLKAKDVNIQTEIKFGEAIINIIPFYDVSLSLESPRNKATEEELSSILKLLRTVKKTNKVYPEKKKSNPEKIIHIDRRIP